MGCLLMEIVIFGLLSSFLTLAARREEGCPDKCGTVTIPYPFGIGDGCSLNTKFNVLCNYSTDPPKAYFKSFEVSQLELDGRLTILHYKAEDCPEYHENNGNILRLPTEDASLNETFPMIFFSSRNKFIVIGCSAYGIITGYTINGSHGYMDGCRSTCNSHDAMDKISCSGHGCCSIDLPEKFYMVQVSADWLTNVNQSSFFRPWPCTNAFIVDGNKFNYSLMINKSIPMQFPIAMDWSVNDDAWLMKKLNSSIKICKENAISYRVEYIPGMRCRCKEGYEGNPYVGCQRIT